MGIQNLPLRLVVAFHVVVLVLFLSGIGIDYPPRNRAVLVLYIAILEGALIAGYRLGSGVRPYDLGGVHSRIPLLGLAAIALLFVPNVLAYTGGGIGNFYTFLINPAEAYALAVDRASTGREERAALIAVKTIVSPLVVSVLPVLGFLYFRYRRYGKQLLAAAFLSFAISVFRGTDKEVFDVAVLVFVAWLAARAHRQIGDGKNVLRLVSRRTVFVGAAVGGLLLAIFSYRKSERLDGVGTACFQGTPICQQISTEGSLMVGIDYFLRYLTQGYFGLSAGLDAEVQVAGTGVGHSRPMQYLFETFLGITSRPGLTDQLPALGWTDRGAWSTGYVWIANDATIYGVPVVILVTAFVFGMGWRQVCHAPDIPSLVVTCYLFYTFIYMIGNLQVAQIGDIYLGLIFWVAMYTFKRIGVGLKIGESRGPSARAISG